MSRQSTALYYCQRDVRPRQRDVFHVSLISIRLNLRRLIQIVVVVLLDQVAPQETYDLVELRTLPEPSGLTQHCVLADVDVLVVLQDGLARWGDLILGIAVVDSVPQGDGALPVAGLTPEDQTR